MMNAEEQLNSVSAKPQKTDRGRTFKLDRAIRRLLRDAIKQSRFSQAQIADKLSIRLDQNISTYMLDAWTSKAKRSWRVPAVIMADLCELTGSDEL
jgi:hypothetical protein